MSAHLSFSFTGRSPTIKIKQTDKCINKLSFFYKVFGECEVPSHSMRILDVYNYVSFSIKNILSNNFCLVLDRACVHTRTSCSTFSSPTRNATASIFIVKNLFLFNVGRHLLPSTFFFLFLV
jgi:hypothetical protein